MEKAITALNAVESVKHVITNRLAINAIEVFKKNLTEKVDKNILEESFLDCCYACEYAYDTVTDSDIDNFEGHTPSKIMEIRATEAATSLIASTVCPENVIEKHLEDAILSSKNCIKIANDSGLDF